MTEQWVRRQFAIQFDGAVTPERRYEIAADYRWIGYAGEWLFLESPPGPHD